jgi:hypothetical protein
MGSAWLSAGGSTTTYSSDAWLSVMAKPSPCSHSRAATPMSASEGSSRPEGWLWTRSAGPSVSRSRTSASTAEAWPRATTRGSSTAPSSPTLAMKHTSLPRARAISRRMRSAASGVRNRSVDEGGGFMRSSLQRNRRRAYLSECRVPSAEC